jgi:hypothetical protein
VGSRIEGASGSPFGSIRRRLILAARPRARGRRAWRAPTRSHGAVADVVGTILLLGLTVTLFASIFFFVNAFPHPPPQPTSQFTSQLLFSTGGGYIVGLTILHLAGPTLSDSSTSIYLYSANHPTAFPTPFTVHAGLAGATTWNEGQTWTLAFNLTAPDNITVNIITTNQLIYHSVIPGQNPNIPPEFVNVGTTPAAPAVGASFTIYAQILDDDLNPNSVFVNVSQIPGEKGSALFQMSYASGTGTWDYTIAPAVTNTSGTFFVFINATDKAKQPNSVSLPVLLGGGSGGTGSTGLTTTLAASPGIPVVGSATTLVASVRNTNVNGGSVSVSFVVSGVTIGTQSGFVGPGSTTTLTQGWTPSTVGATVLKAIATVTSVGSATGTLNLTVFPKILFIAHSYVSGSSLSNESAYLAEMLSAAGFPYTTMDVPCTSALPSSATMDGYNVVVIDFGSNPSGGCPTSPTSTDENAITGTTGVSFWVVGANAFGATSAGSYTAAYLSLFGIPGSGTIVTRSSAPATATYQAAANVGLRSDGIPTGANAITLNKTLQGSSVYTSYDVFSKGVLHSYLNQSTNPVSAWATSGSTRQAALGTDPALLRVALPNGNAWGAGAAGTDLAYNVVDWLGGLSSPGSTGRASTDFAVASVDLVGVNHAAVSTIYSNVRSNGPAGGILTVTLYVNGQPALFNGVVVSADVVVGGNGQNGWASLVWQAPAAGTYTFFVTITGGTGDVYALNNLLNYQVLNQGVTFA